MRHGNLFVISGPSGAGKGTLVARLMQRLDDAWVSISVTTRPPRSQDELDEVKYHFISDQEFDKLIQEDALLEWAEVHGHRYGTPRAPVEEHMTQGIQVLLEIDVQGGFQVREKMPEAHLIFIEPPSLEILYDRLIKRGTEDEVTIRQRMKTAEVELLHKMEYDARLVNDDLDQATDEFLAYINAHADANLRD